MVFKEELHLKPKLRMFCVLSQNYQHCFEKYYKHPEANCLEKVKYGIKISIGQAVLELLIKMCKILF